jgi:hypothetical protein
MPSRFALSSNIGEQQYGGAILEQQYWSSNIKTQLVILVEQTSGHEGVLKRPTRIMVADMRRRPLLSIRWKRSSRRLFIAMASQ